VTERNVLIASGMLGAVAGVAAGYLFFTEQGRSWRLQAEGNLTSLFDEAERLLSAADQVRQSVAELRGGTQSRYPRSA
jgi:hypothetical protein